MAEKYGNFGEISGSKKPVAFKCKKNAKKTLQMLPGSKTQINAKNAVCLLTYDRRGAKNVVLFHIIMHLLLDAKQEPIPSTSGQHMPYGRTTSISETGCGGYPEEGP